MPEDTQTTDKMSNSPSGYGKRPLWQWILLYAVIGGIIYAAIYYFVLAPKDAYNSSGASTQSPQSNY